MKDYFAWLEAGARFFFDKLLEIRDNNNKSRHIDSY